MKLKYDPGHLLFIIALIFEFDGKMTVALTNYDPALKKYEILIEIKNSYEWFKINVDDKLNFLLFRASEEKWEIQNPDELEKNESKLGRVIVLKERKKRMERNEFDQFWEYIR